MIKTKFSSDDLEKILKNYNLGKFEFHKHIKDGVVNTTLLIKTNQGKFILRYFEFRSKEYIKFEINVLNYLSNKNYPCPKPIKNNKGAFFETYNGKFYGLFEYLEGEKVKKLNKKRSQSLVKKLAELHNLTKGYKPKYYEFRQGHDIPYVLAESKKNSKGLKDIMLRKERLNYINKEIRKIKFPNSLPKGVVQADNCKENLKFIGDNVSGVFDFDDSCYTYLIYDIASLLTSWCAKGLKIDFLKAKFLLNEYEKHRKLNSVEKRHIYDSIKVLHLTYLAWFFNETKLKGCFEGHKKKLEYLNKFSREEFYNKLFI